MITCGIDEAGRGPVIGPMVMACAVFDSKGKKELKKLHVRDSKKLSSKQREELEPKIKEASLEWKLIEISPNEIDRLRKRMSLNVLEAMKVAEMLLSLEKVPERIIVDAVDINPETYKKNIMDCIRETNREFIIPEIISEHKADENHIEVGAASILAKVKRDNEIEGIKEKYGDVGSGYPSDPVTMKFLHDLIRERKGKGELPSFVRRSWNTLDKSKQTKLGEY